MKRDISESFNDHFNLQHALETGSEIPSTTRDDRSRYSDVRVATHGTTSGDSHAPGILTSGSHTTGHISQAGIRPKKSVHFKPIEPKTRHASRALYTTCLDCLERADNQSEDFFARNVALEQLKSTIGELWAMRHSHEEPFAEVINMLQSLFVGRRVEDFQSIQLSAMKDVFERLRTEYDIDDSVANDLSRILMQGGLDVFRELE